MSVNLSGYQKYDASPYRPWLRDPFIVDLTDRVPNASTSSGSLSQGAKPPVDTYEPSGSIKLPETVTFTVPDRFGYIDMASGTVTWKENTEHVGESYTVELKPPARPHPEDLENGIKIGYNSNVGYRVIHHFMQESGNYLLSAAEDLAANGKITSPYHNQQNTMFAEQALDFFTGGKYTAKELETLKGQLNQVIGELANQVKDGKPMDITKVNTKLTIGGVETTVSELFEFQKVGFILQDAFTIRGGNLNIQDFGTAGVAAVAAKKFAAAHGALGEMFSKTVDRFYEQYRQDIWNDTQNKIATGYYVGEPERHRDIAKTGQEILDIYSKVDLDDPSSISQAHRKATELAYQHCKRFDLSEGYQPQSRDEAGINDYIAWLKAQIFN